MINPTYSNQILSHSFSLQHPTCSLQLAVSIYNKTIIYPQLCYRLAEFLIPERYRWLLRRYYMFRWKSKATGGGKWRNEKQGTGAERLKGVVGTVQQVAPTPVACLPCLLSGFFFFFDECVDGDEFKSVTGRWTLNDWYIFDGDITCLFVYIWDYTVWIFRLSHFERGDSFFTEYICDNKFNT